MRIMAIDPGTRRVGLAVCEGEPRLALPHVTLQVKGSADAVSQIVKAVQAFQAERIVVGLPLAMSGVEGQAAREARRLARAVRDKTGLPVVMWDERLTSSAAERSLRDGGVNGVDRRKVVDQVAASLLLQSYLDALDHTWRVRPIAPVRGSTDADADDDRGD
jgi:putative Holliday junction resolvase